VYADDIIVKNKTKEKVNDEKTKLINVNKEMGLHVNDKEANYMIVSRKPPNTGIEPIQVYTGKLPNTGSIGVDNYTIDRVYDFKYIGVYINSKNDLHVEIIERIKSWRKNVISLSLKY